MVSIYSSLLRRSRETEAGARSLVPVGVDHVNEADASRHTRAIIRGGVCVLSGLMLVAVAGCCVSDARIVR